VNALQGIAFAMLVVEAFVLLALLIRQGRRQPPWPPGAHDARSRRAERDVRRLMGELDTLVKSIDSRMTSRVDQLQSLLTQAEELAAELQTSPLWPDQLPGPEDREDEELDESPEPEDALTSDPEPAHRSADAERPSLNEASEALRLAKEGYDVVEIAQRLGRPIGEIELLLRLRRASSPNG
jgi:uncharacterized protein DUF6115